MQTNTHLKILLEEKLGYDLNSSSRTLCGQGAWGSISPENENGKHEKHFSVLLRAPILHKCTLKNCKQVVLRPTLMLINRGQGWSMGLKI